MLQTLRLFIFTLFIFSTSPANVCAESKQSEPRKKSTTQTNEIQITLFGQPCLLSGPLGEATLKAIHSISPEQIPQPPALEPLRKALEKIKKTPALPSSLDSYRERMTERLEAQISFLEAIEATKKSGNTDGILKSAKQYSRNSSSLKNFEALLKSKGTPSSWNSTQEDELSEAYSTLIQPDPQEDYHRAIQRMNIHYTCSFDEGD